MKSRYYTMGSTEGTEGVGEVSHTLVESPGTICRESRRIVGIAFGVRFVVDPRQAPVYRKTGIAF